MADHQPVTGDQLTDSLRALGVNFLMGTKGGSTSLHRQPERLLIALAQSDEARLRLSLIPLFLQHPEFAEQIQTITVELPAPARITLQCYYTAAVFLQLKYLGRLRSLGSGKSPLPDHFSRELGLQITNDPEKNLQFLARRHAELGGAPINWLGTYQHAADIWIKGLEVQRR